ncbi:MAG TPA: HEAT repeat domain-containing protein [Kofleriaceae bacterium]|nr:HEAT repeat domain-containing protein [Kofleriaceae bacterium]
MKLWPIALALFAGGVAAGSTQLPQPVQLALTQIDSVPSQLELDTAFSDHQAAMQGLAAIATDNGATDSASRNARLHAISALSKYCASPCDDGSGSGSANSAHQALISIIQDMNGESVGFNAVVLRAAIEALGPQRVGNDLDLLVSQLANPSRDIRAAVAHSLRDLCNTQAIVPLRQQQQAEASDQVKQAITEALRVLGQGSPCQ